MPFPAYFLHKEVGYVTMRAVMRIAALMLIFALSASAASGIAAEKGLTVKSVRFFSYPGFTRIVFETEQAAPYVLTRSGDRSSIYFSSYGAPFSLGIAGLPSVNDGVVKSLEARQDGDQKGISILLGSEAGEVKDFVLRGPDRIVVDVYRGAPAVLATPGPAGTVIVIDPGHGGSETGVLTPQGPEKALTLELAWTIRKILKKSATRSTIVLTREKDEAVSLDERAAEADGAGASVFVSLHVADGPEQHVFLLDPDEGRSLPAPAGRRDFLGFDAMSEHQQALWGAQQAEHSRESNQLGRLIARELSGSDDAAPVQAPLALLKPVAAAAVIVEVGAASNRARAAEAIARGIDQYVQGKR